MSDDLKKGGVNKGNWLALAILVLAYGSSVVWVYWGPASRTGAASGKKEVRMVHSLADEKVQLAFNRLARAYEVVHPDVDVIVQAIPARAYKQWVTTQCIGGTAPDLIQAQSYWDQMWQSMAVRYMTPLTRFINEVNPYNEGTALAGMLWRDTYHDRMLAGYWSHLTEYFSIPLTVETTRVIYNKDIFRQALGHDRTPRDFAEWIEFCDTITAYAAREGRTLFPIAGAGVPAPGTIGQLTTYYYYSLTAGSIDAYDTAYWGGGRTECTLYALHTRTFSFVNDETAAAFEMVRRVAQYCQKGYLSNDFSQARFLFVQGNAAMIVGNTRDVKILQDASDASLGAFDFPLPAADDPEFGAYVDGRPAQPSPQTVHFCLSRTSQHPELALDFMRFCTSVEQNELFNADVHWYPAIKTAKSLPLLEVFKPQIDGVHRSLPLLVAPQVSLWFSQNLPLYLQGELTFETFARQLDEKWRTKGAEDFVRRDKMFQRFLVQAERNVAKAHAQMLFVEAGELKAGELVGHRTVYELALEMEQILEQGITARAYTWHHLQEKNYEFP